MTDPWIPNDSDCRAIFAYLEPYSRAVLAVSGGSDSVALLHLAARWAGLPGMSAPRLSVATVDHGLRSGSADDAQFVVSVAEKLGLPVAVLSWDGVKPVQGIQEQARQARYDLLGRFAREGGEGRCAVVTAHTEDDQAETLLMRLARGSGPEGLQGMRPVRALAPHEGVDLVRPLLDLSRSQLRSYLKEIGGAWVDDPSNADHRFERVRLRGAADTLGLLGLTPSMLARAAGRQRRAVEALDAAVDDLCQAALHLNGGLFARIDGREFHLRPSEIQLRLLQRVLAMFGGTSPRADLAQVEQLTERLRREAMVKVTLGGCEVRACRNEIRVYRELGRADLQPVELNSGDEAVWDNRFVIRVHRARRPVSIRVLDRAALTRIRRTVRPRLSLPFRAAATLPAVWLGEDLIAVGGLEAVSMHGTDGAEDASVEARFIFSPRALDTPDAI